jgi:hypothetical protein
MTRALAKAIPHSTIISLSVLDKSLLALYGIYRAGNEQEVPIASIIKYLYDAFKVPIQSQILSNIFYRAREDKTSLVNFRSGHGYCITPSGCEHIENLLNLKQLHLARTDGNAGSNGAAK